MRLVSIIKDPHIGYYCTDENGNHTNSRNINEGDVHLIDCDLKIFVENDKGGIEVYSECNDWTLTDCGIQDLDIYPVTGIKLTMKILRRAIDAMVEEGSSESYARNFIAKLLMKYPEQAKTCILEELV